MDSDPGVQELQRSIGKVTMARVIHNMEVRCGKIKSTSEFYRKFQIWYLVNTHIHNF